MEELIAQLVGLVDDWGYTGLYILTTLESTFIPIPSELVIVPAGYLAYQGKMDLWVVFAISSFGTLSGALINYYLGLMFGRKLLEKYGKFMFMNDEKLAKSEEFFKEHGAFSMFTGRLIPGVRHYIPFPAGVARMNVWVFSFYTLLGGAAWAMVLVLVGYNIGAHEADVHAYLWQIKMLVMVVIALFIGGYVWRQRRRKN